ncbi:hypothetical protein EXIGLDRAFT_837982, partial [Exidia glandulosa HHB12029]
MARSTKESSTGREESGREAYARLGTGRFADRGDSQMRAATTTQALEEDTMARNTNGHSVREGSGKRDAYARLSAGGSADHGNLPTRAAPTSGAISNGMWEIGRSADRVRPPHVLPGRARVRFMGTNVIDGKRIEDNKIVAIKHMSLSNPAAKHEAEMTRLASSLPGNENRSIFFVDALEDADTDSLYLITEWAGPCNKPEFFNGIEIVDFVHQTLSGLAFLHSHGIVHRDIRAENIRMDHRPLTPGVTPHPQLPLHALDAAPVSEPLRRSEAPRIRYFFQ